MTKERLKKLKHATTWSGPLVSLAGVGIGIYFEARWQASLTTFIGVLVTCGGHWAAKALEAIQAKEKEEADKKMADLQKQVAGHSAAVNVFLHRNFR